MSLKLVVGLGNPGTEYEKTRHNIGFMVIDKLAETLNLKLDSSKFDGVYTKSEINGSHFVIAKPMTFMNLSGNFVRSLCDFYKIYPQNILVIYDDMAFPLGQLKLRSKGSGGGQNGMQNIINRMGTEKIKRIRVGIGSNQSMDKAKYVLSKFLPNELVLLDTVVANATLSAYDFLNQKDFDLIMNKFNG